MLKRDEGQITVFLALLFFVLTGMALCVLEGMYSFMESSLAEDSMKGAGNYVLANYNRNLFDRYHLLFLDPKEREHIEKDGREYLSGYSDEKSFFQFSCSRLEVTSEETAVDQKGLYLKHQIREWMKYRETVKAGESLKKLFDFAMNSQTDTSLARSDMGEAETAIAEEESRDNEDIESSGDSENSEEEQDGGETGIKWKELKEFLLNVTRSGILLYVTDDAGAISNLTISAQQLPSGGLSAEKDVVDFFDGALSFLKVDEWKTLLEDVQMENWNSGVLADEFYLLEYIEDNFGSYVSDNNGDGETALRYETEYLIAGKDSDRANLKSVANRILCLRFLSNYIYLSQDAQWKATSGSAAAALTGILGFPQARKAVEVLLTAAVSFGESMLDTHALLIGEKVPIMKDASTWNLTLENAASLLKNKGPMKQGKMNAEYEDYLKLFLAAKMQRNRVLFRMMDIMQINIALKEPDFLMEDCLFSFRWEAEFSCGGWFTFFPGTGQSGTGGFTVELDRLNSY